MADQGSDAKHVLDDLLSSYREALQTYGVPATMAAVVAFAANVVHEAEHLVDSPVSMRDDILGKWTSNFHRYLDRLNQTCDAGYALKGVKPEGLA